MPIKLYEDQLKALDKLGKGKILYGGVGSGKSITSTAFYYLKQGGSRNTLRGGKYVYMKSPADLYIITTARKRDTKEWEQELQPFLLSPNPENNAYHNRVVIDSWNNIQKYASVKDAFFIFDEQRVVGYGAWTKSFLKIAASNYWILLSATPGDTWSDYIPVFIANGFYKNKTAFCRDHVIYSRHTTYPKIDRYINERYLTSLRDSILVKMEDKRTTVPHKMDILCEYDTALYKTITKQRWNPYANEPIQNASELCYLWRRCVNENKSRVAACQEIVRKKKKVILFYNFDYELDILRAADWGEGFAVAEWNGHKHEEIPKGERWVYLVQYTAGAEGWNCISTDTIVFYSQNYSYKVMVQSSGRIDRLNTPFQDLYYYHLRSMAPIDVAIQRAIKLKKNFNESRYIHAL